MTRTIGHIVATHQIAQQRRDARKPIWDRAIDIKSIIHEDQENETNAHVASVAQRIGALIRAKVPRAWLDCTQEDWDSELDDIVEWLEATTADDEPEGKLRAEFNGWLGQLYNWADIKRVWLGF